MDSEKAMNSGSQLCANGCGFFGLAETQNLCSKCYNDFLKEKLIKINTIKLASLSLNDNDKHTTTTPTSTTTTTTATKFLSSFSDAPSSRKMKNRCESCNKKVGMLGFNCRCGGFFCGVHRYAEEHSCTYDFKNFGRQVLAKNNPLCDADKLNERV